MSARTERVLFSDALLGEAGPGWSDPPRLFGDAPGGGKACLIDAATRRKRHPFAAVGDASWSRYRVEFEFVPVGKGGYCGLNFHTQPNGDACNFHFPCGASGRGEAFQSMCLFGRSCPWQLYPESQGYAIFRHDAWSHVRLDVGTTCANLYVNGGPVLTLFDLPFSKGGVSLWAYYGRMLVRNLVVTDLGRARVSPVFANPWSVYADAQVPRNWTVALAAPSEGSAPPDESALAELAWQPVTADGRGVVNLSQALRDSNVGATAYAMARVRRDAPARERLSLTYTDELTLWCNGRLVFEGEPRGWNAPDREAHYYGRLIPDEHVVPLRLRAGENLLLARTNTPDPWGWGFWMRMLEAV